MRGGADGFWKALGYGSGICYNSGFHLPHRGGHLVPTQPAGNIFLSPPCWAPLSPEGLIVFSTLPF